MFLKGFAPGSISTPKTPSKLSIILFQLRWSLPKVDFREIVCYCLDPDWYLYVFHLHCNVDNGADYNQPWHRDYPPSRKGNARLISVWYTVDDIIGNQAFQNGRCHNCLSLFLVKYKLVTICWWNKASSPNASLFIFTLVCLRLAFICCLGQLYH